jgi:hypothetical protein
VAVTVTPGLFEPTEDPLASGLPLGWELDFWVPGKPQTAGSKVTITKGKGGVPLAKPVIVDSGDRGAKRDWRTDLRGKGEDAVFAAPPGIWPWDGPLEVEFVFVRARPKAHYGTGKNAALLKDSAPIWPATTPDALKLARAAEDALTGIVWVDDARIVVERLEKSFSDRAGLPRGVEGCRVRVRRLAVPRG